MEWSKAKNVLILTFIILNIFLLVNLSLSKFRGEVSKEAVANTVEILSKRGISVKCDIPGYSSDTGMLENINNENYKLNIASKLLGNNNLNLMQLKKGKELVLGDRKLTVFDDDTLIYKDSSPDFQLDIADQAETLKNIKKYLKSIGLPSANYDIDKLIKSPDNNITLTFVEKYKKFIIFDNYIEVSASNKGISGVTVKLNRAGNITKNQKKIIPAYIVLLNNFSEKKKMVITDIDFGFKKFVDDNDTRDLLDSPVWRIRSEDGGEWFYRAVDGKEISNLR